MEAAVSEIFRGMSGLDLYGMPLLGSKYRTNSSQRGYLVVLRATAAMVANMPPSDIATFAIRSYQETRKRIRNRLVKSFDLHG